MRVSWVDDSSLSRPDLQESDDGGEVPFSPPFSTVLPLLSICTLDNVAEEGEGFGGGWEGEAALDAAALFSLDVMLFIVPALSVFVISILLLALALLLLATVEGFVFKADEFDEAIDGDETDCTLTSAEVSFREWASTVEDLMAGGSL